MIKKLLVLLIGIILLLDYAALDDITTGRQNSYIPEYIFLLLSAVAITFIVGVLFYKKRRYGHNTLK